MTGRETERKHKDQIIHILFSHSFCNQEIIWIHHEQLPWQPCNQWTSRALASTSSSFLIILLSDVFIISEIHFFFIFMQKNVLCLRWFNFYIFCCFYFILLIYIYFYSFFFFILSLFPLILFSLSNVLFYLSFFLFFFRSGHLLSPRIYS